MSETDSTHSGEQLVQKNEIENTPFTIITEDGGKNWYLVMGRYRLEGPFETKDEAMTAGIDESWNRVLQVMRVMMEEFYKEKAKEQVKLAAEMEKTAAEVTREINEAYKKTL